MRPRRFLLRPAARQTRARRADAAASGRVWLFDLDNTLHDTSHAIFPAIDRGMTTAVMHALQIDAPAADALRRAYWLKYGSTAIGMHRQHGVNLSDFLGRSHDFEPAPLMRFDSALVTKLRGLPGRKVLLTNAPFAYARKVLRHLGLLPYFESIWALEHMHWHGSYRPKPSPSLLRYVLAREGVPAARAILVEDTLVNLRAARRVGLRTVHVCDPRHGRSPPGLCRPGYVDLRVNSITDLLLRRRPLRR